MYLAAYSKDVFQSLSVEILALQDPSMREWRLAVTYDTKMGEENGSGGYPMLHHRGSARRVGLLCSLEMVRRREKGLFRGFLTILSIWSRYKNSRL